MNNFDVAPVEMMSEGFNVKSAEPTEFSQDEKYEDPNLRSFSLFTGNDGTSYVGKIMVYSVDCSKLAFVESGKCFPEQATLSLGVAPDRLAADLMTNSFDRFEIDLKVFRITLFNGYINRVSFTDEGDSKCSLILDVTSPHIVKSNSGA